MEKAVKYVALDTETVLIADRTEARMASGDTVYTSPFVTPALVVGSWADSSGSGILPAQSFVAFVDNFVRDPETHFIFHHAPFDIDVIGKANPEVGRRLLEAADAGRVHDTKILDVLIRLAAGEFDLPRFDPGSRTWGVPKMLSRSLDDVARAWAGMTLVKDPAIRLTFGQYLGRPLSEMSPTHLEYARQDAVATWRVFDLMTARIAREGWKNWLSEAIQVRAALVCHEMDKRGIAVDRLAARRLRERFEADLEPLEHVLARTRLGRWTSEGRSGREPIPLETGQTMLGLFGPDWNYEAVEDVSGGLSTGRVVRYVCYKNHAVRFTAPARFQLDTRAVRAALSQLDTGGEAPPTTPQEEELSLDADFWKKYVEPDQEGLRAWLDHARLTKILGTYLHLYAQVDQVFPKWHSLGARSGRMAASRPSIQNVPKRKHGIRSLFIARPGHVLVKGDFSYQELITLAEVMHQRGQKDGPLAAAIRSGEDVHRYGAGIVLGKDPKDVTKDERQGQKALHFGVPGGLGPQKLARYSFDNYGVAWTVEQAKEKREKFLEAFPDIEEYLESFKVGQDAALRHVSGRGTKDWRQALDLPKEEWRIIDALQGHPNPDIRRVGEEADRLNIIRLPTGRVRARCSFTEGTNTGFQGLASDVTKEAAWLAERAGLRVVLVVHDEIVIEVPEDNIVPDEAEPDERVALDWAMLEAFCRVCPTFGPYAKVELSVGKSWGPATDAAGKVIV